LETVTEVDWRLVQKEEFCQLIFLGKFTNQLLAFSNIVVSEELHELLSPGSPIELLRAVGMPEVLEHAVQ
jgi:hypothetical protein